MPQASLQAKIKRIPKTVLVRPAVGVGEARVRSWCIGVRAALWSVEKSYTETVVKWQGFFSIQ